MELSTHDPVQQVGSKADVKIVMSMDEGTAI